MMIGSVLTVSVTQQHHTAQERPPLTCTMLSSPVPSGLSFARLLEAFAMICRHGHDGGVSGP